MAITSFGLDEFVSQELSKLTACAPQSLAEAFPYREDWLTHFVLRRMFQNHVPSDKAGAAFVLVRRTYAALDEWELACTTATSNVHKPAVYFKLLRHLESCLSALYQGLEFARKSIGTKFFEKGDGSVYERLNWVYNVSRHYDPETLPAGDLHRIWLTNEGIHTREHAVAFDELREQLSLLGRIVDRFAAPL